jgi:hypothetical protein
MRFRILIAAFLTTCAAAAPAAAAAAAEEARPQPKLQSTAEALPRPTDERLREGMARLRDTVSGGLAANLDEAGQVALAGQIIDQVAAISAGRDFHNRAGRHLQWLLGDITDGAGLMRDAPRLAAKRLGLLRAAETLNFYGREYDHPGWAPLKP